LPEEKELAELLIMLIDEYEERRYPIRKASPQRTLQHLMEARSLTQKDFWKIFGSKGITSEVFHGKRSISKTPAKRLAEFFHACIFADGEPVTLKFADRVGEILTAGPIGTDTPAAAVQVLHLMGELIGRFACY
jgi:antitoxin component HigA of HigAB toxin-antitoxin module